MSRSLKINPEYIPKAELALKQKGYTNKSTSAILILKTKEDKVLYVNKRTSV
jgi:hypothetical protein